MSSLTARPGTSRGRAFLSAAGVLVALMGPRAARAQSEGGAAAVTYSREVSRIIQANCQICHQPGQIGPMSLMTYQDARRYARRIRELVASREMPPYQYDTDVGIQELDNDWRLSDEDISTIVAWVDQGAPEGNPADLPPAAEFPALDEWRLASKYGEPDHVIRSTAWDVPADGTDLWWEPLVETGITEERCIRAVETKP